MNIKRIIVREGLIIISIVFFGVLLLSIPDSIILRDTKSNIDPILEKRIEIYDSKRRVTYTLIVDKKHYESKMGDSNFTPEDLLLEMGRRGTFAENRRRILDESKHIREESKRVKDVTLIKYALLSICLFIYPFYWLVKLIFREDKTLKEDAVNRNGTQRTFH